MLSRRDQTVRDLINSYDVYEDLMAKSQKGLEFYKKLETNVSRLLARCRGICKVQQEEREQITNRYKPKGAVLLARLYENTGIGFCIAQMKFLVQVL